MVEVLRFCKEICVRVEACDVEVLRSLRECPVQVAHCAIARNKSMRLVTVPVLLACTLSACSPSIVRERDLKRPAIVWHQARMICSRSFAVDADDVVWISPPGCENGYPQFQAVGVADPDRLRALREGFDALPMPVDTSSVSDGITSLSDPVTCTGFFEIFVQKNPSENISWYPCVSGEQMETYDDLTRLQEPFRTLARQFIALP